MMAKCRFCTYLLLVALIAFVAVGCKGKKQTEINPMLEMDPIETETATTEVSGGEELPAIDLDNVTWDRDPNMQVVYFDYDSYALRPDALEALRQNADLMKQSPNAVFQVEGHCDERGTQEYNFALGERRALAVRSHLINLGVSGDRLVTVSYGEEAPAVSGQSEAAWSKNRRCEFNRGR